MELQYLPYLVKYLEKLVESAARATGILSNKDYTALLINCYIKLGKVEKVQHLIHSSPGAPIFDVPVVIESCRQQE